METKPVLTVDTLVVKLAELQAAIADARQQNQQAQNRVQALIGAAQFVQALIGELTQTPPPAPPA